MNTNKETTLNRIAGSLVIGIIMLLACCSDNVPNDSTKEATEKVLSQMMQENWSRYMDKFPGLNGGITLYILKDGGNTELFATTGLPSDVTPNSRFRAASITKTLTAAAIMLLDQEGKLSIDDTIGSTIPGSEEPYLPNTPAFAIPNREVITIRQLLSHTAGVYDIGNSPIPPDRDQPYAGTSYIVWKMEQDSWHTVTIEEAASVLSENNLCYNFLPGEDFQYSDTGFTLLAGIIERVSGKSYGEYVMEKLLRPNGMTYSYLPFRGDDQTMPEPVLPGFVYYDGQNTPVESDNISFQLGNGNLVTTSRDLAKWGRALYSGKGGVDTEHVKQMTTVVSPMQIGGYGLGTIYSEGLGYGHSGGIVGYLSFMLSQPEEDFTIVIVCNVLNAYDSEGQLGALKQIALEARSLVFK